VNLNAGAESTIEALLTLLDIASHPVAEAYYYYDSVETDEGFRMYRSSEGERIAVGRDRFGRKIGVFEGDAVNDLTPPE
jgi:hypothetical protein